MNRPCTVASSEPGETASAAASARRGLRVRGPWFRALSPLPLILIVFLTLLASVLAEQRFPPPDFEAGHQLPVTTTPNPRSLAWQYADAAVMVGALGVACWLTLAKRSRRGIIWLSLGSLVYFGFVRKGCICSIGSIQNVALALANQGYSVPLPVLIFFGAPLAASLFAGRAFCSSVCPHGALQDLVLLKPIKLPVWLDESLSILPYVYLGAGILFAATGSTLLICRFDPFVPLFRMSGSFLMLMTGGAFVALSLFVGRPYCRFLCPYGALLKLGSTVSRWKVRITPNYCTQCRLCETSCPFGAIREPSTPSPDPKLLAEDRRSLGGMLFTIPVLIVAGVLAGKLLATPASKLHRDVALAEQYLAPHAAPTPGTAPTPDGIALQRAEEQARTLIPRAVTIRKQFEWGGMILGAWIGLAAGLKLTRLSLRSTRRDFEPDAGACVGCARCFMYCPNERVRVGLLPLDAIAPPPPSSSPTGPAVAKAPSAAKPSGT